MKKPFTAAERKAWMALEYVGPATLGDLELLGVRRLEQLAKAKPQALYDKLCRLTKARQDPCVLDVFSMLVHRAQGNGARPWWEFSRMRLAQAASKLTAEDRARPTKRAFSAQKGVAGAGSAAPGRRRSAR